MTVLILSRSAASILPAYLTIFIEPGLGEPYQVLRDNPLPFQIEEMKRTVDTDNGKSGTERLDVRNKKVVRSTAMKVACALCPTDGKFETKVKEGCSDVQAVHGEKLANIASKTTTRIGEAMARLEPSENLGISGKPSGGAIEKCEMANLIKKHTPVAKMSNENVTIGYHTQPTHLQISDGNFNISNGIECKH